jgi:hypothetical protein
LGSTDEIGGAMKVKVTFEYEPEEPDEGDRSGMSEEEFMRLMDDLMALGANDIEIEKIGDA